MTELPGEKVATISAFSRWLMPIAYICLSLGLGYLSYSIVYAVRQAPDIIAGVDKVVGRIEGSLIEVNKVSELVPPLLVQVEQIQKQIPTILAEVQAGRELVPDILNEFSMARSQIPPVLAEVEAIRETLPAIVKELEEYRALVPILLAELQAYRELAPELLAEVEAVRLLVPTSFDRADSLVANAQKAGQQASEGAVVGLFSGIVKAPLALVGGLGKPFKSSEVADSDIVHVKRAANEALEQGVGGTSKWSNPESQHHGEVTVLSETRRGKTPCRRLKLKINQSKKNIETREAEVCEDDQGKWHLKSS